MKTTKIGTALAFAGVSAALLFGAPGVATAADASAETAAFPSSPCRQYTLPTGVAGKTNSVCIKFERYSGTAMSYRLSWEQWRPADTNHFVIAQVTENLPGDRQGRTQEIGLTPGLGTWNQVIRPHSWVKSCYLDRCGGWTQLSETGSI